MSSRLSIICIWFCFITLLVLGMMMVASTGLCAIVKEDPMLMLLKQCGFGFFGLVAALVISTINYRKIRSWVWVMWVVCCVLLALCYVPGIGMELNGEQRWINLRVITFQPSEIAKICLMVSLADWYTTHREMPGTFFRGLVYPGLIFGIPLVLILCERDMGTAAALGVSGLCVMYVAGVRHWLLFSVMLIGAVVMYDMATSSDNRLDRIFAWLNPQAFSQGAGRQQWISGLAFARGSYFGVGLGDGLEKFGNLPFAYTDFIFAEIGEEWGLVGTGGVLLLFTFLTLFGVMLALQTQDTFGRLLAVGLVCTIFWPAALNMAVVTGLLPNSGLPLPFISTGGTNLVFTILSIGILTSIQRHSSIAKQDYWPRRRLDSPA